MKVRAGLVLGVVFAGVVGLSLVSERTEKTAAVTAISWEKDLSSALSKARGENKLVMVDFYTDWCQWCRRLDSTTLADPRVAEAVRAGFIPVRLNAETSGKEDAARFGVDGYPTVLFLEASGREVYRISGYVEPQDFLKELKSLKVSS